ALIRLSSGRRGVENRASCAVLLDFDSDGDIDLALSDEIADVVVLVQNSNGPNALCPPAPATCRTTVQAGKSSLQLKDKTPDTGDRCSSRRAASTARPKMVARSPISRRAG